MHGEVCDALASLAEDNVNAKCKLMEAEAYTVLVHALDTPGRVSKCVASACNGLGSLALSDQRIAAVLVNAQVHTTLLKVLKTGDAAAKKLACIALRNLAAKGDPKTREVLKRDTLAGLQGAESAYDADVRQEAREALRSLVTAATLTLLEAVAPVFSMCESALAFFRHT